MAVDIVVGEDALYPLEEPDKDHLSFPKFLPRQVRTWEKWGDWIPM